MKTITPDITLNGLVELCKSRIKKIYSCYLSDIPSLELKSAMEYTLNNEGKYLRPLLIYATGAIFDANLDNLDLPAASIELIHTYSLLHDDLSCMDNTDIRRGKPACHTVYGDNIALLTGDALQTLAMHILAAHPAPLKAEKRVQMMKVLCEACGPFGMVAGETLDVTVMTNESISSDLLIDIYRLKTGALFTACMELGRLASKDDDELHQDSLKEFGDCIGLAFQIQDDILDMESQTHLMEKSQGLDSINNKVTYPRLHSLLEAKQKVEMLYQEALEAINYFGHKGNLLRDLTTYILQRKS